MLYFVLAGGYIIIPDMHSLFFALYLVLACGYLIGLDLSAFATAMFLVAIPVLYFAFANVCIIILGMPLFYFLSALRTATMATITAIRSARACLMAMIVLCLVSALLRYAISVDYQATIGMCFAMGLLLCTPIMSHVRNHVLIGMLICIRDILEYNIRIARAIISATLILARYTSNIAMNTMRKI